MVSSSPLPYLPDPDAHAVGTRNVGSSAYCYGTARIDSHGEHFQLDGAVVGLAPPRSRTPEIWVAAHGHRQFEITGRYGDGWIPTAPPLHGPADYEIALKTIQTTAEGAGRRPQTITPSLSAYAVVAPNVTQLEVLLRSKLARYMALMGTSAECWDRWGLDHPFGRGFGGYADVLPEAIDGDLVDAAIDRVPPELVRSCTMSGSPSSGVSNDSGLCRCWAPPHRARTRVCPHQQSKPGLRCLGAATPRLGPAPVGPQIWVSQSNP